MIVLAKTKYRETQEKVLTRGTKALIAEAIEETSSSNRYDLCSWISESLENKFRDGCLDYQLDRMKLTTTQEILDAVDTYAYKYAKKVNKNKAE